jgi:hypothetical protein
MLASAHADANDPASIHEKTIMISPREVLEPALIKAQFAAGALNSGLAVIFAKEAVHTSGHRTGVIA